MKIVKSYLTTLAVLLFVFSTASASPQTITCRDAQDSVANQWLAFRSDVFLDEVPDEVIASISADSKYWLWINGELVVFEGCLKRGPNYTDSYIDKVDIKPFLKTGNNKLALLLWYFGKSGFSHVDSGKPQLYFDSRAIGLSGASPWKCMVHPAYSTAGEPLPNYRLPESSILFDARKDIDGWQCSDLASFGSCAMECESTLGNFVDRPIPQWKLFPIEKADTSLLCGATADTIVARLPYNMQMTPIITLNDRSGGNHLFIYTNHIKGGSEYGVHAQYITRAGEQSYENLGWMNGERLYVVVPHGVEVKAIEYRQSGYGAEPAGHFKCDDEFINRFWEKALHTLYVNMRDTYYDCPDRERAQWWGDATLLSAECAYTFSQEASLLTRKGIHELCAWQKPDGSLFSPIPGIYRSELPAQMLASVGKYGFLTYFMNTGDIQTIKDVYPSVKRYLDVWELEENGLTGLRAGGWNWGDWGENRDIRLIQSAWFYMALEAATIMAALCDCLEDIPDYKVKMENLKNSFNTLCWTGEAYRHPDYKLETDDRAQALAVVSGIAPKERYPQLFEVLKTNEHASPYMEKYVMQALLQMGEGEYALERFKKRFAPMVNDNFYTTLWEGWGILDNGFGGGTTNHAWSGGAMIVIVQQIIGITPLEPGYSRFRVAPVKGLINNYDFAMLSPHGEIAISCRTLPDHMEWTITVPQGTEAVVTLPDSSQSITLTSGTHNIKQ